MTLFVGGVHAVGKTFLLKPVCERLELRHETASELIRKQRGTTNWTASRQVDRISDNQRALVAAINQIEQTGEFLVLDGHFVLRREVDIHERIEIEIFSQLKILGAILLEAPNTTIHERLQNRGDLTWSTEEIGAFSQAAMEHAEAVCRLLDVPLIRLHLPTEDEVLSAIIQLSSRA